MSKIYRIQIHVKPKKEFTPTALQTIGNPRFSWDL